MSTKYQIESSRNVGHVFLRSNALVQPDLKRIAMWLSLIALFIITSCGGGGGTSSGGGATNLASASQSMSFDTTSMDFTMVEGKAFSAGNVNLSNGSVRLEEQRLISFGNLNLTQTPENLFLALFAQDLSTFEHLSSSLSIIDERRLAATFYPNPSLKPGVYSGTLSFIACYLDAKEECTSHLLGSPSALIKYKITVLPELRLNPVGETYFYKSERSTTLTRGSLELNGVGASDTASTQISYTGTGSDWLKLTKTDRGYEYSINSEQLPPGEFTATLTISSKETRQSVSQDFRLFISPNSIEISHRNPGLSISDSTTPNDLQASVLITVPNQQGLSSALGWRATTNVPWISLTNVNGLLGEKLTYSVSKDFIESMQLGTANAQSGKITISSDGSYALSPVELPVLLERNTSEIRAIYSAPYPAGTEGYRLSLGGTFDGTTGLISNGPSPFELTPDGFVQTAPTLPGRYTLTTKNALGISANKVSVIFLDKTSYSYAFIPSAGLKRSLAYDQTTNSLFAADKTNSKLKRFKYQNGQWTDSELLFPNVSDLGLSRDRTRLYVSQTSGSLNKVSVENFITEQSYSFGKGFPEYKPLSQNIPVYGLGNDVVPILTEYLAAPDAPRELSGITAFSSKENRFIPFTGYQTNPQNGGWLVPSHLPELAYFRQLPPFNQFLTPEIAVLLDTNMYFSSNNLSFGSIAPFDTVDSGGYMQNSFFGVVDRKRFIHKSGLQNDLSPLPQGFQIVGSVMSPDWKFYYVLAYPNSALNGDAPTLLKPRVYVYDLSNPFQTSIPLLSGYFEFDDFPTCRAAASPACLLDTTSSITLDGRSLFFAGDKGIAVVPVPTAYKAASISNPSLTVKGVSSMRKAPRQINGAYLFSGEHSRELR
jgi:hypothetical protein